VAEAAEVVDDPRHRRRGHGLVDARHEPAQVRAGEDDERPPGAERIDRRIVEFVT
jgi:hypothetical protein